MKLLGFLRSIKLFTVSWLVAASCVLQSGCTASYTGYLVQNGLTSTRLMNRHALERTSGWRLPSTTRIFLARPQYPLMVEAHSSSLPRSRTQLHAALEQALAEGFPTTTVALQDLSQEEALLAAQLANSEILLFPRLLVYDDKRNHWQEISGSDDSLQAHRQLGRDRAIFQVLLLEVRTATLLDTLTVTSHQRMFARDTVPGELYRQAASEYVALLSGWSPR